MAARLQELEELELERDISPAKLIEGNKKKDK